MADYKPIDQIKDKIKKIKSIRELATPEYLQETTINALNLKVLEVSSNVNFVKDLWDKTNPGDFPDAEVVDWPTLRDEAEREGIAAKKIFTDRIKELEKEAVKETIKELNGIETRVRTLYRAISTDDPSTYTKETMIKTRKEMAREYDDYEKQYTTLKDLTTEQRETVAVQRFEVTKMISKADQLLDEAIDVIEKAEHKIVVEELEIKLARAQKESAEAVQRAEAEKALKEQSIRDHELGQQLIKGLQQRGAVEPKKDEDTNQLLIDLRKQHEDLKRELEIEKRARRAAEEKPNTDLEAMQQRHQGELRQVETQLKKIHDAIFPPGKENSTKPRETEQEEETQLGKTLFEEIADVVDKDGIKQNKKQTAPGIVIGQMDRAPGDTAIELKLETIKLPYFAGELTEWSAFRDLFTYLIDKNASMPDTIKFVHLRSHLRGTAFETIKGYQVAGQNYKSAWEDLKRRFERKDDLVQEYLRKFIEIPAIFGRANFFKIRAIVDGTNQMLHALPGLGVQIENWDPFISLIINTKLDEMTRFDWKQKMGGREVVPVKELLGFLETRAIELQPSQGDRLSQLLKGEVRREKKRIFAIKAAATVEPEARPKNEKRCPLCKGNHTIFHCDKLQRECAKVRSEIIKTAKLCFKCFFKHAMGECTADDCPYCGGPHNVLLCYKRENDTNRGKNVRRQQERKDLAKSVPVGKASGSKYPNAIPAGAESDGWSDWDEPTQKNESAGKRNDRKK